MSEGESTKDDELRERFDGMLSKLDEARSSAGSCPAFDDSPVSDSKDPWGSSIGGKILESCEKGGGCIYKLSSPGPNERFGDKDDAYFKAQIGDCRSASLSGLGIRGLEIRGDVSDASFHMSRMESLDASEGALQDAFFGEARLREANFSGANARDVNFSEADLDEASFDGADCRGADFSEASLEQTSFVGTKLEGADFSDADLTTVESGFAKSQEGDGANAGDAVVTCSDGEEKTWADCLSSS
ncbi:MAG: pentapeptide repeat-containing protein [Myxococcota bacterium]